MLQRDASLKQDPVKRIANLLRVGMNHSQLLLDKPNKINLKSSIGWNQKFLESAAELIHFCVVWGMQDITCFMSKESEVLVNRKGHGLKFLYEF